MNNRGSIRLLRAAIFAASALTALPVLADEPANTGASEQVSTRSLEDQFRDPPNSARPRVWWHWMNGNITKDGIAKDMAWMKRVGIGGLQNFDANLQTPQIVDKRLVYMTPEWKDAFRFAAHEADRLGLELAIAASPGWSETGGPWVKPEDGLKKLVWSETTIAGGKRFSGKLAAPPSMTGPFQSIPKQGGIEAMMTGKPEEVKADHVHYADVRVLAFPVGSNSELVPVAVRDGKGTALDIAKLSDADLYDGVKMARDGGGKPPVVELDYGKRVTASSATLFAPGSGAIFVGAFYKPVIEASDDRTTWRVVTGTESGSVPYTVSFPRVAARYFRIRFEPNATAGISMATPAEGVAGGDMFAQMSKGMASLPLTIGDVRFYSGARVDRYETKAGFSIAQDYYAFASPADGATGISPASVVDITDRMKADGTLDWTPPQGNWKVLRLGYSLLGTENHPAPPEATGLEVDKFDGDAVRRYIEHYIGMYKDAAGADMVGKNGVRAILTDSIEVGAANWTPKMIEQFKRLRGYDPTPWMPALTGTLIGTREQSDKFLYDYRRTLADLMASEHYGTVADVAHKNDLIVYGEALEDHRPSLGDDMAMRSHADIPMSALWTHTRKEGPKLSYIADMRGAASVAHIYGQNLVAAESMTAFMSPWAFGPADLKRVIDIEFVNGVNRPVVHTSVHVPVDDKKPGLSLFIFGQYFNRNDSWAELATPWVDYLSRNSLMLQQGRNFADVGYFYGEEAPLTGVFGDKRIDDAPSRNAYDFVNSDALLNVLSVQDGEIVTPGGARYKALYLGGTSHKMTVAVLSKLAGLVDAGATVVGTAPTESPSLSDDRAQFSALVSKLWPGSDQARIGMGRVVASSSIDAGLAAIGVRPDFAFTGAADGAKLPFLHRRLADGDSYFIVNQNDRPETIEARFRVTGKAPELWRAETGKSEPLSYRIVDGETIVPLAFGPDESVHVVFRKAATANQFTAVKPALTQVGNLAGPWAVSFQEGRGAPASVTMDTLKPLNESDTAGIKYFSGIATYSKDFTTPKGWKKGQPLWLDLGDAREVAEVIVNGKQAGYAWHAPYKVDIGPAMRSGKNTVEVRVANLWVNRLVGDAQPGADKVTWTAAPTYTKDAPLRRSGLIGPVTLSVEGK